MIAWLLRDGSTMDGIRSIGVNRERDDATIIRRICADVIARRSTYHLRLLKEAARGRLWNVILTRDGDPRSSVS